MASSATPSASGCAGPTSAAIPPHVSVSADRSLSSTSVTCTVTSIVDPSGKAEPSAGTVIAISGGVFGPPPPSPAGEQPASHATHTKGNTGAETSRCRRSDMEHPHEEAFYTTNPFSGMGAAQSYQHQFTDAQEWSWTYAE